MCAVILRIIGGADEDEGRCCGSVNCRKRGRSGGIVARVADESGNDGEIEGLRQE